MFKNLFACIAVIILFIGCSQHENTFEPTSENFLDTSPLQLKIIVMDNAFIKIISDEIEIFNGLVKKDEVYTFTADQKIFLHSTNAAALEIYLGEEYIGILGEVGEEVDLEYSLENSSDLMSGNTSNINPNQTKDPSITDVPDSPPIELKIIIKDPAHVIVVSDGIEQLNKSVTSGEEYIFTGIEYISIYTDNAGAVEHYIDQMYFGKLGDDGDEIETSYMINDSINPASITPPDVSSIKETPPSQHNEPIGLENINSLREAVVIQNGHQLVRFTQDMYTLYIADRNGITRCEMKVSPYSNKIVPCMNIYKHYDYPIRLNVSGEHDASDFIITPTGEYFLAVTNSQALIVNKSGRLVGELFLSNEDIPTGLSLDGNYVSIKNNNIISILKSGTNEVVFSESGFDAEFSPDGNYLAIQKKGGVFLYDLETWEEKYSFTQDFNSGWDFSGDGKLIGNVTNGNLILRQLSDGEIVRIVKRFNSGSVILSEEGNYALNVRIFSSSKSLYEAEVMVWDTNNEVQSDLLTVDDYYSDDWTLHFGVFELVDLSHIRVDDEGALYHIQLEQREKVYSENQKFHFTNNNQIVLIDHYHETTCVLTENFKKACQTQIDVFFDGNGNTYADFLFVDDETDFFSYTSMIGSTQINPNASTESILYYLPDPDDMIDIHENIHLNKYTVRFLNSYQSDLYLIAEYSGDVHVLNTGSGEMINNFRYTSVKAPIFSSDNRFAAFLYQYGGNLSDTFRLGVYDFLNHELTLFNEEYRVSAYSFHHDENKLIGLKHDYSTEGGDKILEYNLEHEETAAEVKIEFSKTNIEAYGRFNCIAYSPDDSFIVAGTDIGNLLAFDTDTGEMIFQINVYELASVLAVDFSKDGRMMISSSANGEIKVFRVEPLNPD